MGLPFVELQSVDSTNNYALEQARAGLASHGQAYFAHEQFAGKGQRGKSWATEKDANIILSVIVKPAPIPLSRTFTLSASAALAARDFFARYAGDETRIKWPNDLYWQDRKAGGILIENVLAVSGSPYREGEIPGSSNPAASGTAPKWNWAVIGIGININQTRFPAHLPNPVSLKQISGRPFDVKALAMELCTDLDRRYKELMDEKQENIFSEYLGALYKINEPIKLRKDDRIFECTLKSVTPEGKLVVLRDTEQEYDVGEVDWVTW